MRESVVEQKVVTDAEADGWLVRKCVYLGRRGSPDRWFMKGARLVLMEFKRPKKDAEVQQRREHARLAAAGFPVHVVTTYEQGMALLA